MLCTAHYTDEVDNCKREEIGVPEVGCRFLPASATNENLIIIHTSPNGRLEPQDCKISKRSPRATIITNSAYVPSTYVYECDIT